MKHRNLSAVLLSISTTIFAATSYVSLDGSSVPPYSTWATASTNIQTAVDAATAGDTVILADGRYETDAELFVTNAIILTSHNGREFTTIDAQNRHRALTVTGDAIVTGLTITRGYAPKGAGVYFDEGGTLNYCRIMSSLADFGGGVYIEGNGILNYCVIRDNDANIGHIGTDGGGVYCNGGGTLNYCDIIGNHASQLEGVGASGGGVYCNGGGELRHCNISGNTSVSSLPEGGGGVYCDGGILMNCKITSNGYELNCSGGGIFCTNSWTISNCLISQNNGLRGGGIYFASPGTIKDCTITHNTATWGGGIHLFAPISLTNCILWGNDDESTVTPQQNYPYSANWYPAASTNITCTTCCVYPIPTTSTNCFANDPMFVSNNTFYLQLSSPCVDSGSTTSTNDVSGTSRPLDGNNDGSALPDRGAIECANPLVNADDDYFSDYDEYVCDTDPLDSNDWFRITSITNDTVSFSSSYRREYTLVRCTNLVEGIWIIAFPQANFPGKDGTMSLTDPEELKPKSFYRVDVEIP